MASPSLNPLLKKLEALNPKVGSSAYQRVRVPVCKCAGVYVCVRVGECVACVFCWLLFLVDIDREDTTFPKVTTGFRV